MNGDIIVGAAKHAHDWLDYATAAAAILGLAVLCFYTYYAKKQNKLTEKSLVLGRRAWLVASEVKPEGHPVLAGVRIPCVITLTNAGSTPATNVAIDGTGDLFLGPIIPDAVNWTPTNDPPSSSVLGGGLTLYTKIWVRALSEDEVTQVEKGDATLFLYLRIEYRDIFKKQRWTTACWQYDHDSRKWAIAPKHNDLGTVGEGDDMPA